MNLKMQVCLIGLIVLIIFTTSSYAGSFDWFAKSREGLGPVEIKFSLPFYDKTDNPISDDARVTILYQALKPEEKGVKTEKDCHTSAPKIPVWTWNNCKKRRAVSIFKDYPIKKTKIPNEYIVTVLNKLSGPGDYQAMNGEAYLWVLASDIIKFNFTSKERRYAVVAFPNSDPKHASIFRITSDKLGISSNKTVPFIDDEAERVRLLTMPSMWDAPFAYTSAHGEIIIDHSREPMDVSKLYSCYSSYSDELNLKLAKVWPNYKEHNAKLDLSENTKCLDAEAIKKNAEKTYPYERHKAKVFVQGDNIALILFDETGNHSITETIIMNDQEQVSYYQYLHVVHKATTQTVEFKFWIPGLEKIYPEIAIPPNPERIRKLKKENLNLLTKMIK
jgi:hypothetical protein